jgi:hypothetical protein
MLVRLDRISAWLAVVLAVASQSTIPAVEHHPSGRDIYRQQCAKCHGRNGEGVKGKHEEPLQGNRSLEKLTRYIDRNMPDDNPGKCVGEDAAAVARYIYDSFYSREARLRKNPPRIELLRLTNRQYVNSVADLLKHFTGKDGALTEERGLKATYFHAREFNGEKKLFERVDRQVNFDFSEGSDGEKLSGTNGFSIHWRGSLIAEETGEYEFILKTPNGARLWVNDEEEPLIDAWVASGQVTEQKATIRLLLGRVYPLELKCSKYKEKGASISLEWKPPHGAQAVIPARNLTPVNSSSTLVINTAFPPDDSSLGYERGMSVSKAWDEATTAAAVEVANYVLKHLDRLSHSKLNDTNRLAKIESFCKEFTAAAWRRPMAEQESRLVIAAQFKKGVKTEDSVKRVVLLALKAPEFLYLGLSGARQVRTHDQTAPSDFEVASRLSFDLWDSLPDQELWKEAERAGLRTREQVARQTRRMLGDARAQAKMQGFFQHWLQMDRVDNQPKDDKLFPGFTPAVIADLRTSLRIFLDEVLWSEDSDYRTLLLADYIFLNTRLAEFYGVSTNATDDFVKVRLNPDQRSGVLTHPYLLSAFSYQKMTSPIHRGVFLTRNIVGRALRPPPMAMTFKDADFAPNLTMREKVSQLTRSQSCQGCHSVINPLGFSLEQYDAVGRFRTSDNNQPIDPVSDYITDDGEMVRLAGARDVANFAIGSEQAQNGFIEQLFHHLVKQPMLAYGLETPSRLRASFVASGYSMQKLMAEIATIAALHGIEKTGSPLAESGRADIAK